MAQFILQKGKFNGFINNDPKKGRKRYKVGEAVELTAVQAKSFGDKFKAVELVEAEAKIAVSAVDTAKKAVSAERNTLKAEIEADIRKEVEAEIRAEIKAEAGTTKTEAGTTKTATTVSPTKDAEKGATKVAAKTKAE